MKVTVGQRILLAKTCKMCGKFKQACEFGWVVVDGGKYRNSYCQTCKSFRGRPVIREHQEKTISVAVRHRQPWSDQDIERLLEMAQKGLPGPSMALALNRSLYSVYTMINRLKEDPR